MNTMTSSKPYLLRALYQWIIDNDMTPYVLVDAHADESVQVPREYVKDGEIVINISPSACRDIEFSNDSVHFDASFSGVIEHLHLSMESIMAIYSFENGRGMVFDEEEDDEGDQENVPTSDEKKPFTLSFSQNKKTDPGKSRLTIIK